MAIKEGSASNADISQEKLRVLIYGPPGSGKTWFGANMPKPYFISVDKGLIGVKKAKLDVDYAECATFEDVEQVIIDITNGRRAGGRETLVLDHLTELTKPVCEFVMKQENKKKMDLQAWGIAVDNLRRVLRMLLDLSNKYHIVVIAHEQIDRDEFDGKIIGTASTIGKFSYHVGGLFDLFLYANQESYWEGGKKKAAYKLHTVDFGSFKAKDRVGVLDTVEDNNPEQIIHKILS